jgi:hypothetical protein
MRNILEYPVILSEKVELLDKLYADWKFEDNLEPRMGDMRGLILKEILIDVLAIDIVRKSNLKVVT